MSHGRFAILDPAAGISGDMLLGALVAAGAPEEWLRGLPARLGLDGVRVAVRRVRRAGLAAVKVDVILPGEVTEGPLPSVEAAEPGGPHSGGSDFHSHDHPPAERHPHPHPEDGEAPRGHQHRRVGSLVALVERAPISSWVRERAVRAFGLIAEAEGRVHGVPPEQVELHEVGALDALVDIVGGIEGFERLGITRVYTRPVALGEGWVRAAHGAMAVPAPATALLVEGLEIAGGGPVRGEATTPTGAALLRVLAAGPPPERWRMVSADGWGAGGRDPHGYPNALRLVIAEPAHEAAEVTVLSTDLDDLSPEYLEPLRDALFAAGALDVQVWATQMKKGRTGFRVEVTVAAGDAARVTDALFIHSTTAGVRRQSAARVTLPRRELRVPAADGSSVRVKVLDGPGGPRLKPEYDDVERIARGAGRPAHEVARELHERATRLVGAPDGPKAPPPNEES